jgi:hypothetical protein
VNEPNSPRSPAAACSPTSLSSTRCRRHLEGTDGGGAMPAFGNSKILTPAEIKEVSVALGRRRSQTGFRGGPS